MSKAKLLFKSKPKGPVRNTQNQSEQKKNKQQQQSPKEQQNSNKSTSSQQSEKQKQSKESLIGQNQDKNQNQQDVKEKIEQNNFDQTKQIVKTKEVSLQAKKILNIFYQKQQKDTNEAKKQEKIQEKKEIGYSQQNQKNLQNQTKTDKRLNKNMGKHFKIYNPQHFKNQISEIKTSIHRWTFGTGQTPQQLLITSWNVNGIRARINLNQIQPYVQKVLPDILCINEHKMDEKSYELMPIKFWGYYAYWNFPKHSLGYSGVAVFSKYPAIQMFEDLHIAQHSQEGRVITLEFDKFILVHAYIPTSGRELERLKYKVQEYDPAFREYLLDLKQKYPDKALIVCGDMNVAHEQLDCHTGKRMKEGKQPAFTLRQRNSFSTLLSKVDLVDTFRYLHPNKRAYTWWNMRIGGRQRAGQTGIGKRIDYFLISRQHLKFVKSHQIKKEIQCNDHSPIQMRITFK